MTDQKLSDNHQYDYAYDDEIKRWTWIEETIGMDTYMRNELTRRVVRGMYTEILSAVHDTNDVMDLLFQESVFSIDLTHKILASPTPRGRCRNMLDALLVTSSHSTAFNVFLRALKNQCDWIVKKINHDVDILLNDPNVLASLQNAQYRKSLYISPSTSISAPSLPNLSASNYDSPNEVFVTDRGLPIPPTYSEIQNLPQDPSNLPSSSHNNTPTSPTTKKSGPPPPPKHGKPVPEENLRSALRHLGDQLTVHKHLLIMKDEELRQYQHQVEVLQRNPSGGLHAAQRRVTVSAREKELEEKLERVKREFEDKIKLLEEREKALTAKLEFSRELTLNQLYQRQNPDLCNNYVQPDAPAAAVATFRSISMTGGEEDLTGEATVDDDDTLQTDTLRRETKLKKCYSANDSLQEEPSSTLAPKNKPIVPPRPLPRPPVLPTRQELEGDYEAIPSDGPVKKTLQDFEIKPENIELQEEVLRTKFTDIYKGKAKVLNNSVREVVIKRLHMPIQDQDSLKIFLNEAKALIKLQHLNVIKIEGVVTASQPCHIVLENLHDDDLLTQLENDKGQRMTPQILVNFSQMIADGMNYLEKNNYVHRSLNAKAILLTNAPRMLDRIVKISQFRLAEYVGDTNGLFKEYKSTSKLAYHRNIKVKWTAPEALKNRMWTIKCDVWSFGVLLYEILTYGGQPYPAIQDSELIQFLDSGFRLQCPTSGDKNTQEAYKVIYYQVMLKCWDIIAENRPSFSNLSDFLETLSIQEKATATSNTQDRYTAYPRLVREIVSELENVAAVGGMAILNRKLYISRQGSYIIEVYDEDIDSPVSMRPIFRLNIKGKNVERIESKRKTGSKILSSVLRTMRRKKQPAFQSNPDKGLTDMVALPTRGWLFCTDPLEFLIHRFDPSDLANSHFCWQVEGDPKTISVDKSENLYISCPDLRAIQIYSYTGELIRKIKPKIATFGPLHAVPIFGDRILYCHEQEDADSDGSYLSGQVWICDKSGGNVEKLSSANWICSSNYLAVDSYSNQIICVDPVDRSVWLMNPSGRSQARELLQFNITGTPVRILLRRNPGELYIGMQDGRVLVYEVIRNRGTTSRYETWCNNSRVDESLSQYEKLDL